MAEEPYDSLFATDFDAWVKAEVAHQDEIVANPHIAKTAKGPIEYARIGEGPVVLAIHGGPGGYDQGLLLFEWVTKSGFSLIAPSRPGYLGTPVTSGKSPAEQADLYAALLDTLGIEKVAIICGSAGGASSYEFAIRHPKRVTALVAADAVVSKYLMPANAGPVAQALFLSGPGEKLINYFTKHYPRQSMHEFLQQESMLRPEQIDLQVEAALKDPLQIRLLLRFSRSMSEYPKRKAGVDNDLDELSKLDDLPVGKIQCPALVIHGTHDSDVLFYHGVYAWENIPGAGKMWVREGSHLCAWISPQVHEIHAKILSFLKQHT
ncbi:alpha/beta hydrolase [Methanocalculus taiwanensis]|uniref:Alpha/beta hydrolase n=1 Tax=Methanocalculus taiwanensis TaxID=106207 RepID=A0ABD4TIJ4_9EURY|nr:alpha/beta hydrolase [Methanocalculus taiwanensis]MCQ1538112.1 alpha/beta hydrolase [Methanocalculus taiwanensis]